MNGSGPVSGRVGVIALVGAVHAIAIAALLHVPGIRQPAPHPVIVARVLPQDDVPARTPPPRQFSLSLTPAPRIDVPLPDIIVAEPIPTARVAAAEVAPPAPATTIGAVDGQAAAVSTRPGPPEIQNVRYARPIVLNYPAVSRRLNETGIVLVRVLIDADGNPIEARVQQSSGHPRLDAAAVSAVRSAAFLPYRENGVARVAQALVPVRFELR